MKYGRYEGRVTATWHDDGRLLLAVMPPSPSSRQVAATTAWFREHDVAADDIPGLVVPGSPARPPK